MTKSVKILLTVGVLLILIVVLLGTLRNAREDKTPTTFAVTPETVVTESEVVNRLSVGITTHTITVDGTTRYYKIYAPEADMSGAPVWMQLHGGGQSMAELDKKFGGAALRAIADKNKVLIVFPNGTEKDSGAFDTDGQQRWNDDRAEDLPKVEAIDDVRFLTALIDTIHKTYKTDTKRTYVSGVSNGGFMSQKLLIEAPEYFAAAATALSLVPNEVAGSNPPLPTPILLWVGSEDKQTKTLGGGTMIPGGVMSPSDSLSFWAGLNGVTTYVPTETITKPDRFGCYTTVEKYEGENPVYLYTSVGGSHSLASIDYGFGNSRMLQNKIGIQCEDIEALQVMWDFMSKYSR